MTIEIRDLWSKSSKTSSVWGVEKKPYFSIIDVYCLFNKNFEKEE